jgi:hypothetical protein
LNQITHQNRHQPLLRDFLTESGHAKRTIEHEIRGAGL